MSGRRILVPVSDVITGGFTHTPGSPNTLFDHLDEQLADDSDFVVSQIGSPQSDVFEVALTQQQQPEQGSPTSDNEGGHEVHYRLGKDANDTALDVTVFLLQSGLDESPSHIVAQWTHYDIPQAAKTYTRGLTQGEAQSITDYTDLRLRFEVEEDPTATMHLDFALDSLAAGSPTVANDIDNAILRGPSSLTFTRASDANVRVETGTMVTLTDDNPRFDHNPAIIKPDGTYEKLGILLEGAATNICLQSEALGTTWTNPGANTTITNNAGVAPDGATTAEDVLHGDSAETIQQTITVADNTVHTISAFVKQGSTGNHDFIKMSWIDESAGDNGFEAWFDISTGTVGTAQATGTGSYTAGSASIQDVGNGWYRIWATGQIVSGQTDARFEIINTTADAVDTAETTNSVFWWGLQAEATAYPTSYIATTTTSVTRALELLNTTSVSWLNSDYSGSVVAEARPGQLGQPAAILTFENDSSNDNVNLRLPSTPIWRCDADGEASGAFLLNSATAPVQFTTHKVGVAYAATNDGEMYVNGASEVTDTAYTLSSNAPDIMRVGADHNNSSKWLGHIKNLRYWSVRKPDAFMEALTSFVDYPTMHLDFAQNTPSGSPGDVPSIDDAILLGPSSLTFTRSSHRTVRDETGTLVELDNGIPGFDHCPTGEPLGILIEGAATNLALHSADCTNAAWTKTNVTAAKDATGLDGSANSASSLTSTAGNGTCTQTVTAGSAAHTYSVDVKRKTGTGTIEITIDGGTGWTDITSLINSSSYTRVFVTQTLANPAFGFRIVTSGDAIEVDYNQLEATAYYTSRIATTTASVTRSAESLSTTSVAWANSDFSGSWVAEAAATDGAEGSIGRNRIIHELSQNSSADQVALRYDNNSGNSQLLDFGGTLNASVAGPNDADMHKFGCAVAATNDAELYWDGASKATDTGYTLTTDPDQFYIGLAEGGNQWFQGHIKNIRYWPLRLTDTEMTTLTNNG